MPTMVVFIDASVFILVIVDVLVSNFPKIFESLLFFCWLMVALTSLGTFLPEAQAVTH